jgi:hypothetical protein
MYDKSPLKYLAEGLAKSMITLLLQVILEDNGKVAGLTEMVIARNSYVSGSKSLHQNHNYPNFFEDRKVPIILDVPPLKITIGTFQEE